MKHLLSIFIALLFSPILASKPARAELKRYELTATRAEINLSGKKTVDWALMINGSIPAPTLEFTEGDDAEIVVHNKLQEEVSIHWHGILLPPEEDGVAYVNTPPIMPGKTHTFRFKIRQHGTYWYHSHTGVQEQKGIYGAFVIHPRERKIAYDKDVVVVLSDWSDENADQIIRNLRKDGDYYLYKKDSIRSWLGAIQSKSFTSYLSNEWTRMGGMDLSDVGYDAFLINGKRDLQLAKGMPGDKVRIRIINAAASSYFYVSLGQDPMRVISADGVDIEPVLANEIFIGMAETYDVIFEVPKGKNTELRATVQDVTGYASGWIGDGSRISAPTKPRPNMYAEMAHGGHEESHGSMSHDQSESGTIDHSAMDHRARDHSAMNHNAMDHSAMNHNAMDHSAMNHSAMGHSSPEDRTSKPIESLTVDALKSLTKTSFPKETPSHDLKLVLGGDMERYVWHINGQAIHQDRTIEIQEGDVIRFTFVNDTMMHHPMHLHGHFFRVLNANNDWSPLKHTVDVPPHGTRTIEFLANEPGEWMLHCHNLYHMKTGMARVVKYSSFTPKPEVAKHQDQDPHLHDHLYFDGMFTVATNHAELGLRLSKTWDTLEAHIETREYGDPSHIEGDILYRRWFSNFLNIIAGGTRSAEYDDTPNRGVLGVGYMLPMLIESNLLVDHAGMLRLDLEKRFQWTKSLFTDLELTVRQGAKSELTATLMYRPAWEWSAGLIATEDSLGVGLQYRY